MKLQDLLKTRRVKAGLTQAELSDLVGVSRSAIAQYETGKEVPTNIMLAKLSKVLGIHAKEMKQRPVIIAEPPLSSRTVSFNTAIKRVAELMTRIVRNQELILQAEKNTRRYAEEIKKAQAKINELLGSHGMIPPHDQLSDGG